MLLLARLSKIIVIHAENKTVLNGKTNIAFSAMIEKKKTRYGFWPYSGIQLGDSNP